MRFIRCVVQFNLRLILAFPLEEYILSVKFKNLQEDFFTLIIHLRHNVDHLVAEVFPGCYLDRVIISQL